MKINMSPSVSFIGKTAHQKENPQSIQPEIASEKSKTYKLVYIPELARRMRDLGIHHPAEAAIFVNQLAFWLQTDAGNKTKDGVKWIYNSYKDWTKTQFGSLSVYQFGTMIRDLERLGIIQKENYASLRSFLANKVSRLLHPDQTQSWITLNLERCEQLTGYNPFTDSWKPLQQAEIANTTLGDCDRNEAKLQTQLPTIYTEKTSISTQSPEVEKEREQEVLDQEIKEVYQCNVDFDPWSDEPPLDTHYVENIKEESLIDHIDTSEGECSAAPPPDFENLITESKCDSVPGLGFKKKSDSLPEVKDQVRQVWEIAPKRPYPVFLNWWADKKYKPQGGKWEAASTSNAYSEFYKDCDRTSVAIFPEFLEYMRQVAENCNHQLAAGIKAILPSCFVAKPDATHGNVEQLMQNISQLVDRGVQVALPTNSATPSCTQSMDFAIAAGSEISGLSKLEAVMPEQITPSVENDFLEIFARKQMMWNTAPALRSSVKRWVEQTPGVEITEEGLVLVAVPEQEE